MSVEINIKCGMEEKIILVKKDKANCVFIFEFISEIFCNSKFIEESLTLLNKIENK